ncbi:TniB family NTP-binding protein [Pseudomonas sp. RC2C2]|uniref:TniB family NTP-binding protein n=1 Tax=Pseudomonas sp. RC2C2 TaxID=2834408 RepID=UPI001BCD2FF5|nr:TniB family NTP-binding protein [Pseudomonas sp. RC2C2]MBS7596910.1 TniB family NTP-binding protein [Pseudomonas sp. RC2C2]
MMSPDIAKKLRHLKFFTVCHPMYNEAMKVLQRAAEASSIGGEDTAAALFGPSGSGKTRLCNDLMHQFSQAHKGKKPDGSYFIKPVLYCRVPSEATVKALTNRLLETMNVQMGRQSQEYLEYQLFQTLKSCDTKLLVLDELPHLLRGLTDKAVKSAGDWLKNLIDLFDGTLLITGEPDSESYIDERACVGDRFPYRAYLKPFSISSAEDRNDFERLIRAFAIEIDCQMNLTKAPCLVSEHEILALYALTNGNIRRLARLLYEACKLALERGDGTFKIDDFSLAAKQANFLSRLTKADVFTASLKDLQNIVFNNDNKRS